MKKLILRADACMLDSIFQRIVDWSQRKPEWWTEHSCIVWTTCAWIDVALNDGLKIPGAWLFCGFELIATVTVVLACRTPAGLQLIRPAAWVRQFGLASSALFLLLHAIAPAPGDWAARASSVASVAMLYFACCAPPKPKERRESKLASQT